MARRSAGTGAEAGAGTLIQIEHWPSRGADRAGRRRWLSAEGDMPTSIEKRGGGIRRFEEINAEFNTFKPPPGPGEARTRRRNGLPAGARMPSGSV